MRIDSPAIAALLSSRSIGRSGRCRRCAGGLPGDHEAARQHGRKATPLARNAFDRDRAPLGLDDALGEGEPEAGARVFFGEPRIQLLKLDEKTMKVFPANADSGVAYVQAKGMVPVRRHPNGDAPLVG